MTTETLPTMPPKDLRNRRAYSERWGSLGIVGEYRGRVQIHDTRHPPLGYDIENPFLGAVGLARVVERAFVRAEEGINNIVCGLTNYGYVGGLDLPLYEGDILNLLDTGQRIIISSSQRNSDSDI